MDIPSVPTDKFYKFLTVSGLVMIFVSITYLFIISENNETTEELVLAAKHDVRAHYLKKKIANILERNPNIRLKDDSLGLELAEVENANLFARDQGDSSKAVFYKTYGSENDSLDNKVIELNDLAEELAIEEMSFLIKDTYFIDKAKDKQLAQLLLTSCCIVGVLICFWGFRIWYRTETKRKKK